MRYLACSLVALTSVLLGGCSSGGDVYIETSSALTGSKCELPLAEPVPGCGRWANIPGAAPALLTFLNTSIAVENRGNGDLKDVVYACSEILYRLGVGPEPITPGDLRARIPTEGEATAICQHARLEIDHRRSPDFVFRFGGVECKNDVTGNPCASSSPILLVNRDSLVGSYCGHARTSLAPEWFETDSDYRLAVAIELPLIRLGILPISLGRWHSWFTQSAAAIESEQANVALGHECIVSQAVDRARDASSKHDLAIRLSTELVAGITAIGP